MKRQIAGALLVVSMAVPLILAGLAYAQSTPGYNNEIPPTILTPDAVKTRIGTLRFIDGQPDEATVRKVYDNLDHLRGVETFLNGMAATSIDMIRVGMEEIGATQFNHCVLFDKLMDSNPIFLTGNTDTVYCLSFFNMKKLGDMVVEIPPGCGPGTVNDAFFRFVVDMGAPGPDRGKGGKYLILSPDYDGDLDPPVGGMEAEVNGEKFFVSKSTSYVNWLILRGFLVDGKTDAANRMFTTGVKVYPLEQSGNPPEMKFISGSGKVFNTIHANSFEFYEELHHVIDREPVSLLDPELRGLFASIGIQKGKPFAPDERMKEILTDAVAVGNATARAIWIRSREEGTFYYENSGWYTGFVGGSHEFLKDKGEGGRYLDARVLFHYMATVITPAMVVPMVGKGSQYALCNVDSNDRYLDGTKTYKLNLPANVPARDFWSVVAYDPQTRSQLQTGQPFPGRNNKRHELDVNEDGSVDLYFAPEAPEGRKANWIQTVPGKSWFIGLRLYGPLKPWFEKTWRPGEIELMDGSGASAPATPIEPVRVTADNYVRAESDFQMRGYVENFGCFGKLVHSRKPYDVDNQVTVRGNRDTLYSFGVFDLESPLTITLPDPGGRYQSLMVVNQDHSLAAAYSPATVTLTKEKVGTRYVILTVRTFMDPNHESDLKAAHRLQDAIRVEQADVGTFEVPEWKQDEVEQMRDTINVVASTVTDTSKMFGRKEELDPVHWMLGAALGWGGLPAADATYVNVVPEKNDGKTPYTLTVKDVPVDAFWSVTLYDEEGWIPVNEYKAYSFNNVTAKKDKDGSVTIHFGGDPKQPNFLPIVPGWNYIVRLYRPRKEILDGTWKFPMPEAEE